MPNLQDYGFKDEEEVEASLGNFVKTGYPKPTKNFRFVYEAFSQSIEEMYFWIMDQLREQGLGHGPGNTVKITDVFSASEQSAMFGSAQQRIGLQQDKAAQFLKIVADMIKGLFQIVREIRILDERLGYYHGAEGKGEKAESSEITLKGIWIDLVEGGSKNPASVYGLAREVGFVTLPDLFFRFRMFPGESEESFHVRLKALEKDFNPKVVEVLRRKLTQFYEWKKRTYKELSTRRKFQVKYLRQHYDTIMLYLNWIKPYLRNVKKLGLDVGKMDAADLIGAFEGAMVEIEVIVKKKLGEKYNAVVIAHWDYRTRPSLSYQAEGYQRGPIHVGRADMILRSYIWTDEEVENYLRYRRQEDIELIASMEDSIKEALEALGEELRNYLIEAEEKFGEQRDVERLAESILRNDLAKNMDEARKKAKQMITEKVEGKKLKPKSILEPFGAVLSGFKEMGTLFLPKIELKKKEGKSEYELEKEKKDAEKTAHNAVWSAYKNYKKAHGFLSW